MFLFMLLHNSLKSYVFWRSSSFKYFSISTFWAPILAPLDHKMSWNLKTLYITMSFTIVWKIEVFVWGFIKFVKVSQQKILNFETPCTKHLLSVHRGSSCVNFGQKYVFNWKLKQILACNAWHKLERKSLQVLFVC